MSILYNALSGTQAAQLALNTTSQNIANVMTPGYTRQNALLSTVVSQQTGGLSAGNGVKVSTLMRFSDTYKSLQMWNANAELAQRTTVQPYLSQLEQVMGDDSASINAGLDTFFASLNAASVEPGSLPLRQEVLNSADALAQRVNSLAQVLANQRVSVAQQRTAAVAQLNTLSKDIAALNKQITMTQASGTNPSALIDARDNKIDALAKLVGVHVVDQADGSRSVTLKSGQPLVLGDRAAEFSLQGNPDGSQTLLVSFGVEHFTVQDRNLGGQLGGLDQMEYAVLLPMRQSLEGIAQAVHDQVNAVMSAGYALDGTAGSPMFDVNTASSSTLLTVRPGQLAQSLAFSADPAAPGNSDNLMRLIALKNQSVNVAHLGQVLLGDANTQLVGRLGMQSQQNQASMATAQTVRNQAEESWKATSGVNADEEAISLMQYQQMYQANMKVFSVANELFDSTLSMF